MSKKDAAKSSVKKVSRKIPAAPVRVRPASRGATGSKAPAKPQAKSKVAARITVAKKPAPGTAAVVTGVPRPRGEAHQSAPVASAAPGLPPEIELARIDEQLVSL
ncbi:MAG: hypothetical protein ACKO2P_13920, partial [Planctomycetota bacterium]